MMSIHPWSGIAISTNRRAPAARHGKKSQLCAFPSTHPSCRDMCASVGKAARRLSGIHFHRNCRSRVEYFQAQTTFFSEMRFGLFGFRHFRRYLNSLRGTMVSNICPGCWRVSWFLDVLEATVRPNNAQYPKCPSARRRLALPARAFLLHSFLLLLFPFSFSITAEPSYHDAHTRASTDHGVCSQDLRYRYQSE